MPGRRGGGRGGRGGRGGGGGGDGDDDGYFDGAGGSGATPAVSGRKENDDRVAEAGSYKLFLSDRNASGYKGVRRANTGRYFAERGAGTENYRCLGIFDTAVEAAVAYAASMAEDAEKATTK